MIGVGLRFCTVGVARQRTWNKSHLAYGNGNGNSNQYNKSRKYQRDYIWLGTWDKKPCAPILSEKSQIVPSNRLVEDFQVGKSPAFSKWLFA